MTPLVEFEHALLAALMLIGLPTLPLDSPMEMIDGFAKVGVVIPMSEPSK